MIAVMKKSIFKKTHLYKAWEYKFFILPLLFLQDRIYVLPISRFTNLKYLNSCKNC